MQSSIKKYKNRVDKFKKTSYNHNRLDGKENPVVSEQKKENGYRVSISYNNENPTPEEIKQLQEDVKRILLSSLYDTYREKVRI